MASSALLTLTLVLQLVAETTCVLDFTCFNSHPRIDIDGDNDLFIGGYKSEDDTDAIVTFGRTSNTGTGNGSPSNSYEESHSSNSAKLLKMPRTGGNQRIGAFYCDAQKGEENEWITTIIMDQISEVTPTLITQTVNTGESVTSRVTQSNANLRWRHNGGNFISGQNGESTYTIQSVGVDDAGIYECHLNHRRERGKHAIMQLIVRACQANTWGDACQHTCPYCYNGGICDDKSGECVCAPGFSGEYCKTVHGRNRFGQDGQLRCSGHDDHGDGCRGILLCLPHPYGCSCAAGYMGIDCDIECTNGFYGANCRSKCHCAADVTCLKDTGECNGQCHVDWHGVNCQEWCPEPAITISGLQASASDNIISLKWVPDPSPCTHSIFYRVQYQLTNRVHCPFTTNENAESFLTTGSGTNINNLEFHSTYVIYVTATRKGTDGSAVHISQTTGQAKPAYTPTVSTPSATETNSFTFTWDSVPCALIRGYGLQYKYQLLNGNARIDSMTSSTAVTFNDLDPCTEYQFKVRALNNIGDGSWSPTVSYIRKQIPGKVVNLNVASITSSQIRLTWTRESNYCIGNEYRVQYTLSNRDQCQVVDGMTEDGEYVVNMNGVSSTLSGLFPYSTYSISVTAYNSAGLGESTTRTQTTGRSEPDHLPTVSASPETNSNSLTLFWDEVPCRQRNGPGIHYDSQLRNTDSSLSLVDEKTTTWATVTFSGLQPCTEYWFRVRASNNAGDGTWSQSSRITTRTVRPGPVNALLVQPAASPAQLYVSWQHSTENQCPENNYSVQYQLLVRDHCLVVNGALQTLTTTSLYTNVPILSYSNYSISVSASNENGNGDAVTVIWTTATSEPDSPPESIEAYNVVSNSFGVRWDKPRCGSRNGPILSYTYSLTRNSDGTVVAENTTELEYTTFDELTPFSNYTFQIAAMTEAGTGPKSTIVVMTNEAVPSVPDELQVIDVTQTSIDVTWGVPVYPNGVIDKYMVHVFVKDKPYDPTFTAPSDPEFKMDVDVTSETMTYTFNGLKPSTKYELRVQAATSTGPGDPAVLEQSTDPVLVSDIFFPTTLDIQAVSRITPRTVEIRIPTSTSEFVSGYFVGVLQETSSRSKRQADMNEFDHYDVSPTKYIAGEVSRSDISSDAMFVIGDNRIYGGYYNPPLEEETSYQFYTAFVSRVNESHSVVSWSEGSPVIQTLRMVPNSNSFNGGASTITVTITVAIVGSVIVFLILIVIIAGLALKMRSMVKRSRSTIAVPSPDGDGNANNQNDDRAQVSADGYAEYKKQDESSYQGLRVPNQQDDGTYEDIPDASARRNISESSKKQGDSTYEVIPDASAQPHESSQIEFSSDGYVKYKTGDEGEPYQGIYNEPSDPTKKDGDDEEYEDVP